MILLANQQPGQHLMVTHTQSPREPSSSSFSSSCNWSPAAAACRLSSRWRRPRVAARRSAHAAGGLKASTEEELPTVPRSSTPGKVYLQLSRSTKSREKQQRWQLKHSSRHTCTWLSSPQRSSSTSGNILTQTVSARQSPLFWWGLHQFSGQLVFMKAKYRTVRDVFYWKFMFLLTKKQFIFFVHWEFNSVFKK